MKRRTTLVMGLITGLAIVPGIAARAQGCPYPVQPKSLVEAGKIQMSINPTLPPQQYIDEKGELKGLNVDLTKAIAQKLCVDPVFIRMDPATMVPALRAGRYDMVNTGLFWTKERAEIMSMVPYGLQAFTAIAAKDSKLRLSKPEDMAALRVGAEVNAYPFVMVNRLSKDMESKGLKPIIVQGFGNTAEALGAMHAGQIDLVLTPDNTAVSIQERGGGMIALGNLWASQICFAFRDKDLADKVAQALGTLKAEGVYDKVFDEFKMVRLNTKKFSVRGPDDPAID